MRVKKESEKAGLTTNIQKTITLWQIIGEKWKEWKILFPWAPKSLWIVTAVMKLKKPAPWKESYDNSREHIKKQRYHFQFSSVQLLSRVWLFVTPWTAARQASLSIADSRSLLKLMSMELVMPSNHLTLCHPVLLSSILSSIRIFLNESILHIRWSKFWSFSFSISPANEYSGLISFRTDWLDLPAVQGTLKNLLQHQFKHSNTVQNIQFFSSQLSWWSNSHIHTWLLEKP